MLLCGRLSTLYRSFTQDIHNVRQAMGRSPLDVQRQMGHTTLTMTNHYASLTVQHLQKSHGQYSPMRAEKSGSEEALVRVIGLNSIKR